jgi:hypothetical protein
MAGVVKLFASWMMSWVLVSVFFQMTRCPTLTVVGLGANELLPLMPMILIVASASGVGVGDEGVELPQPAATAAKAMRIAKYVDRVFMETSQAIGTPKRLAKIAPLFAKSERSPCAFLSADVNRIDFT